MIKHGVIKWALVYLDLSMQDTNQIIKSKTSTPDDLFATHSKERGTFSCPCRFRIVVDREKAVAEQEPQVPTYVRK